MNDMQMAVMFFLIFGGGGMLTKMWADYNKTRIEIARIKLEQRTAAPVGNSRDIDKLRSELEATREELRNLRETSTQYDLSFDAALGRVENRVAHVEQRVGVQSSDTQAEIITLTGR